MTNLSSYWVFKEAILKVKWRDERERRNPAFELLSRPSFDRGLSDWEHENIFACVTAHVFAYTQSTTFCTAEDLQPSLCGNVRRRLLITNTSGTMLKAVQTEERTTSETPVSLTRSSSCFEFSQPIAETRNLSPRLATHPVKLFMKSCNYVEEIFTSRLLKNNFHVVTHHSAVIIWQQKHELQLGACSATPPHRPTFNISAKKTPCLVFYPAAPLAKHTQTETGSWGAGWQKQQRGHQSKPRGVFRLSFHISWSAALCCSQILWPG